MGELTSVERGIVRVSHLVSILTLPQLFLGLKCATPQPIQKGRVSYTSTSYKSTVNYTCEVGYSLRGPSSRVCRGKGLWSGPDPSCGESIIFITAQ